MAGKCYLDVWSLGNSMQSAKNIAVKLQDSIATIKNGVAKGQ